MNPRWENWKRERIKELVNDAGDFPAPWSLYPYHPYSMGWRMGGGEGDIGAFWQWWSDTAPNWSIEERIAYFKRWPSRPGWQRHIVEAVFDIKVHDMAEAEKASYFAKLEAQGFPDYETHLRDLEDPNWD